MNSSVKFFEPTVIVVCAFAGFGRIRLDPATALVDEPPPPPHDAMPKHRTTIVASAIPVRPRKTRISPLLPTGRSVEDRRNPTPYEAQQGPASGPHTVRRPGAGREPAHSANFSEYRGDWI